jgi:DNA-binding NtrC family response regulator
MPSTTEALERTILVIDDHQATLTTLRVLLRRQGWQVQTAACGFEGLAMIAASPPDLALVDLNMEDLDGLSVLARLRETGAAAPPCMMISAENSVPAAVEAMRLGARDFLVKPINPRLLIERVRETLGARAQTDTRDPRSAWRDMYAPGIVGDDDGLLDVFDMLERVAPTDCTVLIQGESGTGKELVARALHLASVRRDGPFVTVNCAAIPETLIESELFGHTRGAFSGAIRDREGSFAAADGGTLFLDEIGELSRAAQAKLLRVLQNGEITPVGEAHPRCVDVRIVTATNRDLVAMSQRGRFRSDLFYRLNQIPLRMPSLRERVGDIPRLAEYFLRRATIRLGRDPGGFSPEALDRLCRYPWPGNVRELENAIERVVVLQRDEGAIDVADLPAPIASADLLGPVSGDRRGGPLELPALPVHGVDLRGLLGRIELELIQQALTRSRGNRTRAAHLLRLNRTTLVEKLRRSRTSE